MSSGLHLSSALQTNYTRLASTVFKRAGPLGCSQEGARKESADTIYASLLS